MALPCNTAHGPAFHPWPAAPANLTILANSSVNSVQSLELQKKQTTFKPIQPSTL